MSKAPKKTTEHCLRCLAVNTYDDHDFEKDGYTNVCQRCGKEMFMCDSCWHSSDNKNHKCDWHIINGRGICFRGNIKEEV